MKRLIAFGCSAGLVLLAGGAAAQTADIGLAMTDGVTSVTAGGATTYTIVMTNDGPDAASGVAFVDTLPARLTFTSLVTPGGWTCTTPAVGASGQVQCSSGTVAVGTNSNFALTVGVDAAAPGGSTVSNTVAFTASDAFDPNASNNSATDIDTVIAVPPPAPVPTMTEWAMILLTGVLAISGLSMASRRRVQPAR
ncbi:DUF11 domain-containing protein [Brevundimonas sp. NIBR11]|uniref:DUF11 domain-containing protein n=1 Tax=Brevundimonas sp. NIBR11 TaxID=3015999 RepID=UPI0022EFF6BF|nr:DUF11 domain-containing protein [Brevundimonas sp. NIBR11]WGM30642.1 hypothetical protein KKHFBJBL_00869 [Brevundimonas sp. NIBR11]